MITASTGSCCRVQFQFFPLTDLIPFHPTPFDHRDTMTFASPGSSLASGKSFAPAHVCHSADSISLASPLRSSPLSNPPVYSPNRTPSPSPVRSHSLHSHGRAKPRAIPSDRRRSTLGQFTPSRPSPGPSTMTPTSSTHSATPSPPLSRSHPLLGSYSLSLLHSRMSHAHAPHSLPSTSTSGFSLSLGALGKGKSCPPELRCPEHETIPFKATYYDMEGSSSGAAQTPWVGTVDLEEHYFSAYSLPHLERSQDISIAQSSKSGSTASPPRYPGYRVAPVGQLQLLIKTPSSAVKVFLVPYDLRDLPVGGRKLVRERTFVDTPSSTPAPSSSQGSPARAALRYSYQLQFICLPNQGVEMPRRRTRESSTTRKVRRGEQPRSTDFVSSSSSASSPSRIPLESRSKSYYLSRSIKVIFTSSPPESHEIARTERADEVILPSDEWSHSGEKRGRVVSLSPGSFGRRDDWGVVRQKWLARKEVAERLEESNDTPSKPPKPARTESPALHLRSMSSMERGLGSDATLSPSSGSSDKGFVSERGFSPVPSSAALALPRSKSPSSPYTSPKPLLSQITSSRPPSRSTTPIPPLLMPISVLTDGTVEAIEGHSAIGTKTMHAASLSGVAGPNHVRSKPRRASPSREERELSEKLRNGLLVGEAME